MPGFKMFGRKKRRKYPVKVDERGRSARGRCFEMFAEKIPFVEITKRVDVPVDTVRRYHLQWKKDPDFEKLYAYVRSLFEETPERDNNIELYSRALGIEKEQFEDILSQPHGLRRLMTGKFYFPAHAEADHKRHIALKIAFLISDHFTRNGGKFEDIYTAMKRFIHESMKHREEEDAVIEEENKWFEIVHKVVAADIENERLGRVKPYRLSEEERNAIIRWGIKAEKKNEEISYWLRIGILMAGGLTQEEAREKMYQDSLEKGDLKKAKMLREFQDKFHPLKTNDQTPPAVTPTTNIPRLNSTDRG